MDGFLLIDKPRGITSHDVCYRIKRKFGVKRVGHTGTLDPFARGLMILTIGKATKLSHLFFGLDKTYVAQMVLGRHYDTLDTTGNVLAEKPVRVKPSEVKASIESFLGTYQQLPPMYSAIKHQGKRLYELAREGQDVERKTREVSIRSIELIEHADHSYRFEARVSKGTYVRSLALDIAARIDEFAALDQLCRTSVGAYHVDQAKRIEDVEPEDLITLQTYFQDYPQIVLSDYLIRLVKNGIRLDQRQTSTTKPFVVCNRQGEMIAYYEPHGSEYKPILIF
jgi:tRNA pseudouridine55 synthase